MLLLQLKIRKYILERGDREGGGKQDRLADGNYLTPLRYGCSNAQFNVVENDASEKCFSAFDNDTYTENKTSEHIFVHYLRLIFQKSSYATDSLCPHFFSFCIYMQ
jgi:hypothetical protein